MPRERFTPSSRTAAVVAAVGALGLAVLGAWAPTTLAVLPACTPLPGKTCYGDVVNAYRAEPDAAPDRDCTSCLQSKQCCDVVGDCDDDPECVKEVLATHACVIDGGAAAEAACKASLTSDKSRALYDCMRASCGPKCAVPSCTLSGAVVLLSSPSCDRCMGGACCDGINACYGNRACKLTVECIVTHCPRTLGPSLTALGTESPATLEQLGALNCGRPAAPSPVGVGPGPCVERCLDEFVPVSDAGTPDDVTARCLAFGVFACGARAGCGAACGAPDSGPYAPTDEWPEDRGDASDGSTP